MLNYLLLNMCEMWNYYDYPFLDTLQRANETTEELNVTLTPDTND